MTSSWNNETQVLDRIRERIPNIQEMFNGAVAGPGGFTPSALSGIWSDFTVDLETRFESLAISMTNEIRKNGDSRSIMYPGGKMVLGRIGMPKTTYKVVWYWFILHAVIISGTVLFCIVTMFVSRTVPIWKSHSLATMSQVPPVVDLGPEAKSIRELEKRANNLQVSLLGDEKNQLLKQKDNGPTKEDGPTKDEQSSREGDLGVLIGRQKPV